MKRSIFLLITAAFAALFGGMMFFLPATVIEEFGTEPTLFSTFLMREMGLVILCSSVMNFLVRNDSDSNALKAILIFNMVYHLAMIPIVFMGVSQGIFTIYKAIPGLAAHLFIGVGSLIYLRNIKTSAPL